LEVRGSARERLFDAMTQKCSLEELRSLAQRMGVASDTFIASTRAAFAQGVFAHYETRNQLADLRFGLVCTRPDLEDSLYAEGS